MIATLCVNQDKIELPIEFIQQYNIKDNSFIDFVFGEQENTALLRVKDNEKPAIKSGFGMVKTNIPAVPVDFDVSVFAKPEDYGIVIPEGSVITINIPTKLN